MRRIALAAILSTLAASSSAQPFAYIANQQGGSISVIDTATDTVVDTISTGPSAPNGIALSPDGGTLYASASDAGVWELLVIDLGTGSIVASPPVGNVAEGLAITPDGSQVFVAETNAGTVSILDTTTNTIIDSIAAGAPRAVAAHPDGTRVYVSDLAGLVHEIEVASSTVTDSITMPAGPFGLVVHPVLDRLYVATFESLAVIDLAGNTLLASIPTGTSAIDVAVTCDRAFVTDSVDNRVSVIDLATNTLLTTVAIGVGPWGIDSHPDGSRVYGVNLSADTVSVIDTATLTVSTTIPVGNGPTGIGQFVAGSKDLCAMIFADGFESGDTSAWQ